MKKILQAFLMAVVLAMSFTFAAQATDFNVGRIISYGCYERTGTIPGPGPAELCQNLDSLEAEESDGTATWEDDIINIDAYMVFDGVEYPIEYTFTVKPEWSTPYKIVTNGVGPSYVYIVRYNYDSHYKLLVDDGFGTRTFINMRDAGTGHENPPVQLNQ